MRRIGVDLRALQVGHQYRGVGEVVKRTLNGIFARTVQEKAPFEFFFYEYDDEIDPKEFLEIPEALTYKVIKVGKRPSVDVSRSSGEKLSNKWHALFADPLPEARKCHVFLQYDYALGVPLRTKTLLVKHDLIPYIFWNDYFESAWVPFKNKAARTTLRTLLANYEFKRVLTRSLHHAKLIVCVSDSTRNDLQRYFHIKRKKLRVIPLGVSAKVLQSKEKVDKSKLPTKPYILFIGGIDGRRRAVGDLVAAYNNLKADGHDIQLALVGENFQSVDRIPNEFVRREIQASSYGEDILCLGYIDDGTKQKLYQEAQAFAFPTLYEGFGIPVLEAMLMSCPVVAYNNSSIPEVGGDAILLANNWMELKEQIGKVLTMSDSERTLIVEKGKLQATKFSWDKTANEYYLLLAK